MARISTYIKDNNISREDFVIGSDGDNNQRTSQFSVGALADFIAEDFQLGALSDLGLTAHFAVRLLYGYSDSAGLTPDLFDSDGAITPKYAGASDADNVPAGAVDPDDGGAGTQTDPFGIMEEPAKPPYFKVVHDLETTNIDVNVLRRTLHTPPTTLWASTDTTTPSENEENTLPTQDRYTPYAPFGVYIVDENTIHVDLGPYELYDVIVIVTGNLKSEA